MRLGRGLPLRLSVLSQWWALTLTHLPTSRYLLVPDHHHDSPTHSRNTLTGVQLWTVSLSLLRVPKPLCLLANLPSQPHLCICTSPSRAALLHPRTTSTKSISIFPGLTRLSRCPTACYWPSRVIEPRPEPHATFRAHFHQPRPPFIDPGLLTTRSIFLLDRWIFRVA